MSPLFMSPLWEQNVHFHTNNKVKLSNLIIRVTKPTYKTDLKTPALSGQPANNIDQVCIVCII